MPSELEVPHCFEERYEITVGCATVDDVVDVALRFLEGGASFEELAADERVVHGLREYVDLPPKIADTSLRLCPSRRTQSVNGGPSVVANSLARCKLYGELDAFAREQPSTPREYRRFISVTCPST